MKRLFWLSVGAAAGYYAARKGTEAVEQARERGLVGNVSLAAATASKVAGSATRATSAVASRSRPTAEPSPAPAPSPTAASASTQSPSTPSPSAQSPSTSPSSREVRP